MSCERPVKRAPADQPAAGAMPADEANTPAGDGDDETLLKKIKGLPVEELSSLALSLAKDHPSGRTRKAIESTWGQFAARERAKVLDFERYAHSARSRRQLTWSSGYPKDDIALEVIGEVASMMDEILEQMDEYSLYGTKRNAVEALYTIYENLFTVEDCGDRKFREDCDFWPDRLVTMINKLDEGGLHRLRTEARGVYVGQLRRLVYLADQRDDRRRLLRECSAKVEGEGKEEEKEKEEDEDGQNDGKDDEH